MGNLKIKKQINSQFPYPGIIMLTQNTKIGLQKKVMNKRLNSIVSNGYYKKYNNSYKHTIL